MSNAFSRGKKRKAKRNLSQREDVMVSFNGMDSLLILKNTMQHGFNYTSQPTHIPLLFFTHMGFWERWKVGGEKGKGERHGVAQATESGPVPGHNFSSFPFQKESFTVLLHPAREHLLTRVSFQLVHLPWLPGYVHLVLFTVKGVSRNSEAWRRNIMGSGGGVDSHLKISHLLLILYGMYNTVLPGFSGKSESLWKYQGVYMHWKSEEKNLETSKFCYEQYPHL